MSSLHYRNIFIPAFSVKDDIGALKSFYPFQEKSRKAMNKIEDLMMVHLDI